MLSDTDKIVITVCTVIGCFLLAALVAIAIWYFNISNARLKYRTGLSYFKSPPIRSLSEIENELRKLDSPHSAEKSVATQKMSVQNLTNQPSTNKSSQRELISTSESSSIASGLVVIRESRKDKSKKQSLADTHIGSATSSDVLRDTRVSTISSDVESEITTRGLYGGVLWPDVIDPYQRSRELELRIGDSVASAFGSGYRFA